MPRSQSLLGSILEVHGLTRHANPVLIGVDGCTWLVDRATVDGAKHRGVDWTGFNTGNFCGELAQERLDSRGVACALNVERAGKLAFPF